MGGGLIDGNLYFQYLNTQPMRKSLTAALLLAIGISGFAQEQPDLDMVNKFKKEGLDHSQVMDYAFHLTDVSGPRLTASPGFDRAANWAVQQLTSMGLSNARLEPWGEFGKGWQQERCYIAMTAPYYQPILAIPRAWTGSTPGKCSRER